MSYNVVNYILLKIIYNLCLSNFQLQSYEKDVGNFTFKILFINCINFRIRELKIKKRKAPGIEGHKR